MAMASRCLSEVIDRLDRVGLSDQSIARSFVCLSQNQYDRRRDESVNGQSRRVNSHKLSSVGSSFIQSICQAGLVNKLSCRFIRPKNCNFNCNCNCACNWRGNNSSSSNTNSNISNWLGNVFAMALRCLEGLLLTNCISTYQRPSICPSRAQLQLVIVASVGGTRSGAAAGAGRWRHAPFDWRPTAMLLINNFLTSLSVWVWFMLVLLLSDRALQLQLKRQLDAWFMILDCFSACQKIRHALLAHCCQRLISLEFQFICLIWAFIFA